MFTLDKAAITVTITHDIDEDGRWLISSDTTQSLMEQVQSLSIKAKKQFDKLKPPPTAAPLGREMKIFLRHAERWRGGSEKNLRSLLINVQAMRAACFSTWRSSSTPALLMWIEAGRREYFA